MRAERHTFFADLAKIRQAENLKPAGVGEDGSDPRHESMQPAHLPDGFDSRPQIKMIGIAEQNLDAQFFQHILRNALHRSQRSNRHENRRFNLSVRRDQFAGAGRAASGFNLQLESHRGIVTELEKNH